MKLVRESITDNIDSKKILNIVKRSLGERTIMSKYNDSYQFRVDTGDYFIVLSISTLNEEIEQDKYKYTWYMDIPYETDISLGKISGEGICKNLKDLEHCLLTVLEQTEELFKKYSS